MKKKKKAKLLNRGRVEGLRQAASIIDPASSVLARYEAVDRIREAADRLEANPHIGSTLESLFEELGESEEFHQACAERHRRFRESQNVSSHSEKQCIIENKPNCENCDAPIPGEIASQCQHCMLCMCAKCRDSSFCNHLFSPNPPGKNDPHHSTASRNCPQ